MKTQIFAAMALSAIAFSSCTKENDNNVIDNGRTEVQFTSGIEITKAHDTSWDNDDEIGIYMVKTGQGLSSSTIAESASNIKYVTTSGDGKFSDTGTKIYFPLNGDKVDFISYYPYNSAITADYVYPINITDQTTQKNRDVLYANGPTTNNIGKGTPKVNLQFHHKLTKVIFNITKGSTMSDANLDGLKVRIKNIHSTANLNLPNGVVSEHSALSSEGILMKTDPNGALSQGIIIPKSGLNNVILEFELADGSKLTYKLADNYSFLAETKYTYAVTLNRTAVEVEGTIEPWTEAPQEDVPAH